MVELQQLQFLMCCFNTGSTLDTIFCHFSEGLVDGYLYWHKREGLVILNRKQLKERNRKYNAYGQERPKNLEHQVQME